MKKLLSCTLVTLCFYMPCSAQIKVVDNRHGVDTTAKPANVSVVDHRNHIDMSAGLVQPSFENMPVYRIQLRITTGRGEGASTNDRVYVKLSDDEGYWKNVFTYEKKEQISGRG